MTLRTFRTAALTTIAAVAITVNASAQTAVETPKMDKVRLKKALDNFRSSLRSDYSGIVEGTLYNIVVFKKYYPELDYSPLLSILNKSTLTNEDAALRYKAHLAAMYLSAETGVDVSPVSQPTDHEYIFRQIAQQLEKKFLVTNEQMGRE